LTTITSPISGKLCLYCHARLSNSEFCFPGETLKVKTEICSNLSVQFILLLTRSILDWLRQYAPSFEKDRHWILRYSRRASESSYRPIAVHRFTWSPCYTFTSDGSFNAGLFCGTCNQTTSGRTALHAGGFLIIAIILKLELNHF